METLIAEIVAALEPCGVFNTANLLDPASLVRIALTLADSEAPDTYRAWLEFTAERHEAERDELAANVLLVLGAMGGYVRSGIVHAARRHSRELVP